MASSRRSSISFAAGPACAGETNWNSAAKPAPGDFIYVPPYVPHQEINALASEPCEAVVVRSGQEPIVVNLDLESPEPASAGGGNQDLGSVRSATTDSTGTFRFADVAPGTCLIAVQATGFKAFKEQNIVVSASETRDVGKLALELGSMTESISVTAEATPIQLASSEKAQLIDANQLKNVTLKGSDLFGYMKRAPGVIDTTASRDVTSPNAIGGITINGNTSAKNFTVDGITDMGHRVQRHLALRAESRLGSGDEDAN